MDFMTSTILSGIVYDIVKNGIGVSITSLKTRLKSWLVNDDAIREISTQLNQLNIDDDMSERAIQKSIESDKVLMELLQNIKPNQNTTNIMIHSGSGDNVAGDKIIN